MPTKKTVAADVAEVATDLENGDGVSNFAVSLIRTYSPYIAGLIISAAVTIGLPLDASVKDLLGALLTFVLGSAWYVAVRKLEAKWPKLGWFLGHPAKPVYSAPSK